MDSSLHELWQAASSSPFHPVIRKESQLSVGFFMLIVGLGLTGSFFLKRSFINVPLQGIPASLAIAIGVVYMFCAVGVYV